MGTGKPDSRETHITRVFGTNKAGDRLDEIWVDVERVDLLKSATQVSPDMQWQGYQRKFNWCDDPNTDDYDPNGAPSRHVEIVKVCDPNAGNVDDPEEWVPIKVIRSMRPRVETGMASNGGTAMERFLSSLSDDIQTARIVEVRKIVHHDTNVDDEIQAAADADPGLLEYVVPSESYTKDGGSKDEDQYVDHEIITYLKQKGNAAELSALGRQTRLLNEYLIDASEPAEGKVIGAYGVNPPYRLDPYQNIINVNFGLRVYVVVMASHGDYASPNSEKVKVIEQRSDPSVQNPTDGSPISAVLIECSADAGDNFLQLQTSLSSSVSGPTEFVIWYVCPKTEEVKNNWFEMFVASRFRDGIEISTGPFLWRSGTMSMWMPALVRFKIRYAPHLAAPGSAPNKMVQMYAMTGANSVGDNVTSGWSVLVYRLDKKGTGALFKSPPEWATDVVEAFGDVSATGGLLFGKDPTLIAADLSYAP